MGKGRLSPDRPRGTTTTDPARGPAAPLRAGATPGPSSSDPSPARDPAPFLAGVWVGASWPSPELLAVDPTVPTNPIRWSLALERSGDASAAEPAPSPVTAFGAGFFDDSADVPGHTHLWFTLRGHFDARTREVRLDKVYERPAPEGEAVRYVGKLHALNGAPEITGTWENATHGTNGTFSCMLRTGEGAQDGDAIARSLGGR
jgi:hypothetical protein